MSHDWVVISLDAAVLPLENRQPTTVDLEQTLIAEHEAEIKRLKSVISARQKECNHQVVKFLHPVDVIATEIPGVSGRSTRRAVCLECGAAVEACPRCASTKLSTTDHGSFTRRDWALKNPAKKLAIDIFDGCPVDPGRFWVRTRKCGDCGHTEAWINREEIEY